MFIILRLTKIPVIQTIAKSESDPESSKNTHTKGVLFRSTISTTILQYIGGVGIYVFYTLNNADDNKQNILILLVTHLTVSNVGISASSTCYAKT